MSSVGFLIYLEFVKPFTNGSLKQVYVYNEILVYMAYGFCYAFSDYTADAESRWAIGYLYMGYVLFCITLNGLVLLRLAFLTLKNHFRPKRGKQKQKHNLTKEVG